MYNTLHIFSEAPWESRGAQTDGRHMGHPWVSYRFTVVAHGSVTHGSPVDPPLVVFKLTRGTLVGFLNCSIGLFHGPPMDQRLTQHSTVTHETYG